MTLQRLARELKYKLAKERQQNKHKEKKEEEEKKQKKKQFEDKLVRTRSKEVAQQSVKEFSKAMRDLWSYLPDVGLDMERFLIFFPGDFSPNIFLH